MSDNQHNLAERIRRGEAISPPLALLLSAASWGQRAGMALRLRGSRTRVDARVISFGNLTAGGTGKTPAVIERAGIEAANGAKIAILTRGYGSTSTKEPLCIPPGEETVERFKLAGDEAALIAMRIPGVWIVKCADRVAGARAAIMKCECDTIILDDGYQAVALERDENILLIDARNPFGNRHILPRGILREPISAIERATEIILTRCDEAKELSAVIEEVKTLRPDIAIRLMRHAPTGVFHLHSGKELGLDFLEGRDVTLACGIAQPECFRTTLEALGANVRNAYHVRDHAPLPTAAFNSPRPVIITEKDAVRFYPVPESAYALRIDLRDI